MARPPALTALEMGPWRERAACANRDDIDWFPQLPTGGNLPNQHPARVAWRNKIGAAKAVCATCEVRDDCLAGALSMPAELDFGIRGGLTENERRKRRDRRRAS